jgi:ribosomal protein S18 acetylase RimI-like enzyme
MDRLSQDHRSNSELEDITVRRMSPGDMDAACEVLGLAFASNPNTLAVAGGDRVRARRMMQTAVRVAKLGRRYSHVLVAKRGVRLVGALNAAQWPHCQLRAGEKLKTAPAILGAMGSALVRQLRITSAWSRHDPREPHWHVGPIGVHPEFQGRGVGKALLRSFLEMVDEQSLPTYLETDVDRNVALYEKFGFKVIAEEGIWGINNRFMWRPGPSAAA